jgi:spermidine/putrescine transport system permease protein
LSGNFSLDFALTLKWYASLLEERALVSGLQQSAIIATLTAVLATVISLAAALAYFALHRSRTAWFLTVILPMFVPGVIQGLALSTVFTRIGIKASALTVTAGHLLWAMPFAFIVILTSFAAVKPSYLMAAADLGTGRWRQFRDITLPLIRPGLVSAFIFSFLLSLNEFTRSFLSRRPTEDAAGRSVRQDERRRLADDLCNVGGDIHAVGGACFPDSAQACSTQEAG